MCDATTAMIAFSAASGTADYMQQKAAYKTALKQQDIAHADLTRQYADTFRRQREEEAAQTLVNEQLAREAVKAGGIAAAAKAEQGGGGRAFDLTQARTQKILSEQQAIGDTNLEMLRNQLISQRQGLYASAKLARPLTKPNLFTSLLKVGLDTGSSYYGAKAAQ